VGNIDEVLEHFGATLRAEPSADSGQPVWSVATVLGHIRDAGNGWRADRLTPLPDLKFTYEQEERPEEFFTPYLWSVVFERASIGWDTRRIALFDASAAAAARAADADADATSHLPPLTSVDVDEAAIENEAERHT
jgi:hypothetical protein